MKIIRKSCDVCVNVGQLQTPWSIKFSWILDLVWCGIQNYVILCLLQELQSLLKMLKKIKRKKLTSSNVYVKFTFINIV